MIYYYYGWFWGGVVEEVENKGRGVGVEGVGGVG
jgi:hypothetical protein